MTPDRTVFIVDDDQAVLNSLRWLLESAGHTVETFTSAPQFLDRCNTSLGGCLLLDIRMPGMDGIELQEELNARGFDIPIVIISGHADVATAIRTMKAGAIDLIEKPFADQELLDRIDRALRIEEARSSRRSDKSRVAACLEQLTPREREVMDLVVTGSSNKQIAEELHISNKTVEAHRAKVMKKMEAESLAGLVRDVLSVSS